MSTIDERCGGCAYALKSGDRLECRRNPPVRAGINAFPIVTDDGWCGEHKARKRKRDD